MYILLHIRQHFQSIFFIFSFLFIKVESEQVGNSLKNLLMSNHVILMIFEI